MPERPATSWWQAARWDDVRTLKSHAGDVNRRNGHGQTALHVAAFHGFTDLARALIGAGASTEVLAGTRALRRPRAVDPARRGMRTPRPILARPQGTR